MLRRHVEGEKGKQTGKKEMYVYVVIHTQTLTVLPPFKYPGQQYTPPCSDKYLKIRVKLRLFTHLNYIRDISLVIILCASLLYM